MIVTKRKKTSQKQSGAIKKVKVSHITPISALVDTKEKPEVNHEFESYSFDQFGEDEEMYSQIENPSQKSFSDYNYMKNDTKKSRSDRFSEDSRIQKILDEEYKRISEDNDTHNDENKKIYTHFNDLQGIAKQFNLDLNVPEIVVVGMQSDGKSSFVEALLGFQFNTIETQIGTRRPLILQMQMDPTKETPHCTFYKEDLSGLEDHTTPVSLLETEIKKRTEALCGKNKVHHWPIILRVLYKNCANLTIYDTPGFRKAANDPLGKKITKMVLDLIKKPSRIIVCLEQSTVEWCNVQVRPFVQTVDPDLSRTVLVTTKFNNRTNQFKNKQDVDKYLEDAHKTKEVFFISLPSGVRGRDLTEEEFKEAMKRVYLEDLKVLLTLNFNEKYKPRIGIHNFKKYLEKLLNEKYRQCLQPVLQKLESTYEKNKKELANLTKEITELEREDVEQVASQLIHKYMHYVHVALQGTTLFSTEEYGLTLEEEKAQSGLTKWPNYEHDWKVRNSQYKLYGGAQLERLLAEFEVVAHSMEFPQTSDDEVAVTIGLNSLHTTPDYDRGASDLAQKKCRMIFRPLIDVLLQRSKFIMRSLFKMVIEYISSESKNSKYNAFLGTLLNISDRFVDSVLIDVRKKADDEFDTFTKIMDWDLMEYCTVQVMDYDLLNPKSEDTLKRVQSMTQEQISKLQDFGNNRSRELTPERCTKIKLVAAKLFAGVRTLFVKYMRAKYNAFFLDPIFTTMDDFIRGFIKQIGPSKLKEIMGCRIDELKKRQETLKRQIAELEAQKQKFTDLINAIAEKEQSSKTKQ